MDRKRIDNFSQQIIRIEFRIEERVNEQEASNGKHRAEFN